MELPEYSQYQLFICGNEQWLANSGDPKIETDLINELNRSSKVECQVWKGQSFKELQTNDSYMDLKCWR